MKKILIVILCLIVASSGLIACSSRHSVEDIQQSFSHQQEASESSSQRESSLSKSVGPAGSEMEAIEVVENQASISSTTKASSGSN